MMKNIFGQFALLMWFELSAFLKMMWDDMVMDWET